LCCEVKIIVPILEDSLTDEFRLCYFHNAKKV
jgi:hypothetical protein